MKKLIFISSPYVNPDAEVMEENYRRVSRFSAKLNKEGILAISPITIGHTLVQFEEMPLDWEFWKDFCLALLIKCDELYVYQMPGWERSRGMAAEIAFAEQHGIPVTYVKFEE